MLPSRCAGIGPRSGTTLPYFSRSLRPDVRVKRQVERPKLLPQSIQLLGEGVRRHVVPRPPHGAGVAEPQLARALVRQLDEALVARLHRRRDAVPPLPDIAKAAGVSVLREDLGDLFDVQALLVGRLALGAVLASSVRAAHRRHEARQLAGFLWVRGSRHGQRVLQHSQLALLVRSETRPIEPSRLLRVVGHGRYDRPDRRVTRWRRCRA